MTAQQLYDNINNAANKPYDQSALQEVESSILKFSASECRNKSYRPVVLSDLGVTKLLQVRCGKCEVCKDMLAEQWFTRMWHETRAHKQSYFITLKYKPFANYSHIPQFLRNAYWHFDDYNSTKHLAFHPCLLRIEHFQYFIRNLRRITGLKLSYFAALEYGDDYGRPHIHCVLWSDSPILRQDVENAWSYNAGTRKQPIWYSIGQVDYNDLQTNGTIVSDPAQRDGHSARNCFKYLSRYMNKYTESNYTRVEYFRQDIINGVLDYYSPEWLDVFDCSEKYLKLILLNDYENFIKSPNYNEKSCFDLVSKVAREGRVPFYALFRSRATCSRSEGIGAVYLRQNIDRLAAGYCKITDNVFGTLVCPAYYIRKAKELLNPFVMRSHTPGSDSYSAQNRPYQVESFTQLLDLPFSNAPASDIIKYCNPLRLGPDALKKLLHSPYSMKNLSTHERLVICGFSEINGKYQDPYVFGFTYNCHTRTYVNTSCVRLYDFAAAYKTYCEKSRNFTENVINRVENDNRLFQAASVLADTILLHSGRTFASVQADCFQRQKMAREEHKKRVHDNYSPKIF